MGTNFNVGSFFSSSNNGNSNFLADYASIKSGSYKRLMKSYYGTGSSSSTSATGKNGKSGGYVLDKILEERRNPKVSKEAQEANENLTAGLSSLNKSVSALRNDSTFTDTQNGQSAADKVVSAVKAYVSDYNDVVSSSKRSTMSNKASHVANMMKSSKENADKLAEIGVTINYDGTLQVNEGKLKAAGTSKVQELFSPKDSMSYGSMIASRAQFASITGGTVSKDNNKTETTTGSSAAALKKDSSALASAELYEKMKDKDGKVTDKYDVDKIFATAKSFVNNYNGMLDAAKTSSNSGVTSNVAQIKEKTANNASALKKFGISVDAKGQMSIDEDTFKKADMSQVQRFFKNYGSSISTNASLVDYYMTTQASAASGYTAAGAYNVGGSSRYADSI